MGHFTTEYINCSATAQSHFSAGLIGFWAPSSLYIRDLGVQRNPEGFFAHTFHHKDSQASRFWCSIHADSVAAASLSRNWYRQILSLSHPRSKNTQACTRTHSPGKRVNCQIHPTDGWAFLTASGQYLSLTAATLAAHGLVLQQNRDTTESRCLV